jgi:hypothetical protein
VSFPVSAPARTWRAWLPAAVAVAVAALVVGVGTGLLWRVVAPRVEIVRVQEGYIYAEPQPEEAVAADGWFGLLGLVAGLLVALLAWALLRRHRGLPVLVGLLAGSLVGAWLGWWFAVWLDENAFRALADSAQIGAHLRAPLSLGMTGLDHDHLWPPKVTGVVLAQALAAAIAYTTFAGFSPDPLLRAGSERTDEEPVPVGPHAIPSEPAAATWPPAPSAWPPAPTPPAASWPPAPTPPAASWPPAPTPPAASWPPAPTPPAAEPSPGSPSSGQGGSAGPTGWPVPPGSG